MAHPELERKIAGLLLDMSSGSERHIAGNRVYRDASGHTWSVNGGTSCNHEGAIRRCCVVNNDAGQLDDSGVIGGRGIAQFHE